MKKTFLLLTASIIGSQLSAQDSSASTQLEEVIITANRMEQKQSQTGKVITVISKDVLEKSQGKTVAQVLNEQAGITINGALNNAGTVQTVFMRGAASGRVLVLIDGIPVGDPSFISNEFDLNFLSITDITRIEIAKGAQSTLYGSDAVAGVINIITVKKNVTKPFNLKSTISAGNYKSFRGNLQLYGKTGKLSYQTKYSTINTGGFSAAYDKTGTNGFDKDGYHGNIVSAALQYQSTKQLSFRSFLQNSSYKTDADASAFTDDKDFTIRNSNFSTGAGFTFKNETVTLNGNYQYNEYKRSFLNDSGDVSGFAKYSSDHYFSKAQFAELYATIKINRSFTLLQGGDYRFGSFNNQYLSISSFGPYTTNFSDTSVSQSSLYASLIYNGLHEKLNIELGGRLNVHSRYGSNYTYTFNPSYAISKSLRMFGSIASGFKAPGLYQLYSGYGNSKLKPEESKNVELGLQQQVKKFNHRLVYFYREIKSGIDFDYVNYLYFNFTKQFVRGLEYETSVQLNKAFRVTANYTYINGTELSQSRITFNDTAYSYLLRRPAHTFNATAAYTNKKLSASVNGRFTGKRYDVAGYAVKDENLNGYFLLNAYAEYRLIESLKFFADAQNITNKQFYDLRGFNSIPFMINAGLTFNW